MHAINHINIPSIVDVFDENFFNNWEME